MKNINKTCLITGANGYLGQHLSAYFESKGWSVIKLVRNPRKDISNEIEFFLDKDINLSEFSSSDLLIHAAYDFTNQKINIDGSIRLIQEAQRVQIKKLLHISSISAYNGCFSEYGKIKLDIENHFLNHNGINIRAGLIYGENTKGITAQIKNKLKNSLIIPVIGNGKYPVYLTDIRQLFIEVYNSSISNNKKLTRTVISSPNINFIELLKGISESNNYKNFFVYVPWRLVYLILKLIELCGIRSKFKSDSVLGLVYPAMNLRSLTNKAEINFREI
jgi:nucleoside-diphosphate-sugar epimerase